MSDEEDEEAEPTVELGPGATVAGAPLARIASRLSWPQERERIVGKVGEETIRTPDGPRVLAEVLEEVDVTYFARRQEFVEAVEDVVGVGPIPTED